MKYKVGDVVVCKTAILPSGLKRILIQEPQEDWKVGNGSFQIAAIHSLTESYSLIIEDDMLGWVVGEFQIQHL